jgi:hypothetical protein
MDLSSPFVSLAFGLVFFSTLFLIGIYVGSKQWNLRFESPSSPVPQAIQQLYPENGAPFFVGPVPWSRQGTAHIDRVTLQCRLKNCEPNGPAFRVTLPRLTTTEDAENWDPTQNSWHLSSQVDLRTGYPTLYPVATVLDIPQDTPSHVQYILDSHTGNESENVTGLKAMIQENNKPLDMGLTWSDPGAGPSGLNVTGDFAHSFVVVNQAKHTIFFAQRAVSATATRDRLVYWKLAPNSWTLFWPADRFWRSIQESKERYWNAATLPESVQNGNASAYIAETIMYDVLAAQAPIA